MKKNLVFAFYLLFLFSCEGQSLFFTPNPSADPFPAWYGPTNNWTQFSAALNAIQPTGQTASVTALSATGFTATDKWRGGTNIPGNKSISLRYSKDEILVSDLTGLTFTEGVDIGNTTSYAGGYCLTLDDTGNPILEAAPLGGNQILRLNLSKDLLSDATAISRISIGTDAGTVNSQKYYGGKRSFNGKTYWAPYNAIAGGVSVVLVVRPNGTYYLLSLDAYYDEGFRGVILLKDGRLVLVPYDATRIVVITPSATISGTDDVITYVDHASLSTTAKWDRGATGIDGDAYFCPDTKQSVGHFDADTNTFETFGSSVGSANGFRMVPSGLLIPSIVNSGSFYTVNTATQTVTTIGSAISGSDRLRGIVGGNDGRAYTVGLFDSEIVYQLMSSYPISENFNLSPFVNN